MVSFIKEDYVRCVWQGMSLPLGKNGDDLVRYFKEHHDINIEYLIQTKTIPGQGPKGSRVDQIFNVKNDSLEKLNKVKEKLGILTAKEVVRNNDQHLYNERVYLRYLKNSENALIKSGEIKKEDAYQITK